MRFKKHAPMSFWDTRTNEVRLLGRAEPVHIIWKNNKLLPSVAQYPLSETQRKEMNL